MVVNEIKKVELEFTKEEIEIIDKAHDLIAELLTAMEQARCREIYCEEYDDNRTFSGDEIIDIKQFLYWLDKIEAMY